MYKQEESDEKDHVIHCQSKRGGMKDRKRYSRMECDRH